MPAPRGDDASPAPTVAADGEDAWRKAFDEAFSAVAENVQRRVWRGVYGADYPEGIDPYSFVSLSELHTIADELRVGAGDTFGDLGCGQGGPGLWLAAHTGAGLVGVDLSAVAVQAASARSEALGLDGRARFRVGTFAETGLATGEVDALLSIDALIFAPDKAAAAREFARVLRPGGRLCLTTWDYHRQPAGRPPQVDDHRPVLAAAGFTVLRYAETDQWRFRATAVCDRLIEASAEIAAESGQDAAEVREGCIRMRATVDDMIRRVLVVAVRN